MEQFLVWAEAQPGRFELADGEVYAMAPETAGHAERKAVVYAALKAGVYARGLHCHALPDAMTVRIDEVTAYEPDALVYCGTKIAPSSVQVPNPVIVVEVLSPSTGCVDALSKLSGYFRVPSIAHYLIVDPAQPLIIHHARSDGDTLITLSFAKGRSLSIHQDCRSLSRISIHLIEEERPLLRQFDLDLDARIPFRDIADVLILEALGDDRHLLLLALAASKRLQLLLDIVLTVTCEVRRVGIFGNAVDAMTDGADLLRLLSAGIVGRPALDG
jgi:Uma2 family endonuclease